MSHLGRWITALVDEELDGAERDRVLNHLAGCEPCRRETNALRALKRRMTTLGDTRADSAIVGRLIDLAISPATSTELAASSARRSITPPWARGEPYALRARPGSLSWKLATGSAAMALAVIGLTAFVLGGAQSVLPEPRVTPSVDTYWLQHFYDTGQVRAVKSGSTAPAGPASPSTRAGLKSGGSWPGMPVTPALRGAFATIGSDTRAAMPTLIMPTPQSAPAAPTASASAGPTPTAPALTMYGPSRPGPTAPSAIP